jgi:hypothetical protein
MTSVLGSSSGFIITKKKGISSTTPNASGSGSGSGSGSSSSCCCPSTTVFLQTLTDKLYEMATSLKQQFVELAEKAASNVQGKGIIIAAITVSGSVTYKIEYAI